VALFAENREGALHAQLYKNVHPVRCEPGVLEIRVGKDAPQDLASRVMKCLAAWTGQRWVVSFSKDEGEPTLAERDAAVEKNRQDRAIAHPLMQAVVKAFPDAKLKSLRHKAALPAATIADDGPSLDGEEPPPIEYED
jgi:DNA polymerase-3 subunit gamma/tau